MISYVFNIFKKTFYKFVVIQGVEKEKMAFECWLCNAFLYKTQRSITYCGHYSQRIHLKFVFQLDWGSLMHILE